MVYKRYANQWGYNINIIQEFYISVVSLVICISEPVHVFITQQSEANNHVGRSLTNHNPSRAISHPLLAIVGINLHRKGLGLEAHIDHLRSWLHLGYSFNGCWKIISLLEVGL